MFFMAQTTWQKQQKNIILITTIDSITKVQTTGNN